jgi:NAD(P)-dependent dehydrogenase (short-subunit alcohol dehydrogenase family)
MSDPRAAFVTGCNGSIGQALCEALTQAGYLVIATDRDPSPVAVCDNYIEIDLVEFVGQESKQTALQRAVRDALRTSGAELGLLVNNAAIQVTGPLDQVELAAFELSHRVNVTGPLVFSRLFAAELRSAQGSIVNIGSVHTRLTKPGFGAYSVSKAGLGALTRALALDFAGDVTVNTVSPAAIDTPMLRAGFAGSQEKLAELDRHHPVGRIGMPQEVAHIAVFLASNQARFITGTEVCADGGIGIRLHDPA